MQVAQLGKVYPGLWYPIPHLGLFRITLYHGTCGGGLHDTDQLYSKINTRHLDKNKYINNEKCR